MSPSGAARARRLTWLLLIAAGLFLWCFAEALFCNRMFAWRDATHFYYPLFQFVQDQWNAGQLPLWNPYENAGAGLLADPAGSVFYPGKLIFFLPIGYAWAYKIYVAAHVVLAAWLAFRAARHSTQVSKRPRSRACPMPSPAPCYCNTPM